MGSGRPCSDCPYKNQDGFGEQMVAVSKFTQEDWDEAKRYDNFPRANVGDVEVSYDINMVDYYALKDYLESEFGKENVA